MKTRFLIPLLTSLLFSCKSPVNQTAVADAIVYGDRDQEILEQILELHPGDNQLAMSELMVKVGRHFLGTPYVAHTLETEKEEQLIINLRGLDCTTYAENCLAISRTIRSGNPTFDQFTTELRTIRYRDGKLDGYPSRLDYFCDWIHNNQQKKLLSERPQDLEQSPFRKEINFMSMHPRKPGRSSSLPKPWRTIS